jgi:uncharacterized protein DUF6745
MSGIKGAVAKLATAQAASAAQRILRYDSTKRSEAIAKFGEDKWIKAVKASVVETFGDRYGTIYLIPKHGLRKDWMMLRVVNSTPEPDGSRNVYWLRVPNRRWHSTQTAVAWTFGLAAHGYQPSKET